MHPLNTYQMENKYLQFLLCTTLLCSGLSLKGLTQITIPNSKLYVPEGQFYNFTIWQQNTSITANGLDSLKFDSYEITTKEGKTGEVFYKHTESRPRPSISQETLITSVNYAAETPILIRQKFLTGEGSIFSLLAEAYYYDITIEFLQK